MGTEIITGEDDLIKKEVETVEEKPEFSEQTLIVQQMLNKIKINNEQLEENGLYNEETKNAIIKLQNITDFTPNGVIDQNLMFRLNEIIENPVITEYNKNKTFAVLYNKYKENISE